MQILEYIWLDAKQEFRSKTQIHRGQPIAHKVINGIQTFDLDRVPAASFDGSSTDQANTRASDIVLKPVRIVIDPLRTLGYLCYLVLCETYTPHEIHLYSNTRSVLMEFLNANQGPMGEVVPQFGVEQEYFMGYRNSRDNFVPFVYDETKSQGNFYCGIGTRNISYRSLAEDHMVACLEADLLFAGYHPEVGPGQWEYQIGHADPIIVADDYVLASFILQRLAEQAEVVLTFHPKPIASGDWNGSGAHVHVSTAESRVHGTSPEGHGVGRMIEKLRAKHAEHMEVYGEHNELRLTGKHETSSINEYSAGNSNREASVRVPLEENRIEDRRPAANMDVYLVFERLLRTIL